MGLVKFSGPGAPNDAVGKDAFALTATVLKSVALLPVSNGRPVAMSLMR